MRIELGDYVLEIDSKRTKQTYFGIQRGGTETCSCSYCKNYLAALQQALPSEVMRFFAAAGIDPRKDAEVYEQGEIAPRVHSYGGEYYFWGEIVSQARREQVFPNGFRFVFMQPSPLAQEQFKNEGALCFYFTAEIPWVLGNE